MYALNKQILLLSLSIFNGNVLLLAGWNEEQLARLSIANA